MSEITTDHDTINLLKECDAGSKMAVASIDEVLDKVTSQDLKDILNESKNHHEKLGDELHSQLLKHGSDEKNPNPMAKGMSYIKTNMMMAMKDNDHTVADLMTDGCNMGVKSLHKYLNQYCHADDTSKKLCNELIDIEQTLCRDLKLYL